MAQKIDFQIKRCTSTTRTSYTPANGEQLYETDTNTIYIGDGVTVGGNIPSSGVSGEDNTASNVGASGVGVFKQKTGFDLEFKNVNAGSNKVSVTEDAANSEIDINVNEDNFTEVVKKSSFNNKGDILAATADNTFTVLPVGNDGEAFYADSTQATGLGWRAPQHNRYKLDYKTANYALDIDLDQAIVSAQTTDITVTLPEASTFDNDGYGHEFMFVNLSPAGSLTVSTSGSDTLSNGLTSQKVPYRKTMRMAGAYPTLGQGWVRVNSIGIGAQYRLATEWNATNFTGMTSIPWDTEDKNFDDNVYIWSSSTNSERLYVGADSCYCISVWGNINSTGGSSYQVEYQILKNGVDIVPATQGEVGNYQNEDSSVPIGAILVSLEAGDYIEVQLDQNSLTGTSRYFGMSVKTEV